MASSYSPSLRLELMATGDQSGTWGDTTNTNLGTLLEQAITGVLSVAQGDTTLTLTNTDGASNQARNAVINLTGAMTAGRNVVVPTANKVYIFKNSTTGGFATTIKTAAGSGVAILNGQSRLVYCDGTNVVDGLSLGTIATQDVGSVAITGGTISGVTITSLAAALEVASGGTAIASYTAGDLLYASGATTLTKLAKGTALQVLRMNAGATAPEWAANTTVAAATQAEMEAASSTTVYVSPGRLKYHPNVPKVWGYITYGGGTPTLLTGNNISSLGDDGTGQVTVNFTTSFSGNQFAPVLSVESSSLTACRTATFFTLATGSVKLSIVDEGASNVDSPFTIAILGDQ